MTARLPNPRYRLPRQPAEVAAALGINLQPSALLASVSAIMQDKLGTRLDHVYPATPVVASYAEEFSA